MAAMAKFVMGFCLFGWAIAACATQSSLPERPLRIIFEPMRNIVEREFASEYTVSFPSPITSSAYPSNNIVRLRVFLPTDRVGPVPVVILLHFWGATDNALEEEAADFLVKKGIAAILVPLPYHLSRTPSGFRSGELTIQPDPAMLRETMLQSLQDVRRTIDWIETREEFNGKVGIGGTSLGAIVATLCFAVDQRIAASSFILGGADLAGIIWGSSRVVQQREELRRRGFSEARLREELALVEPLNYLTKQDQRPSFLIKARHDTVVPPATSDKLAEALGNPRILVIETGHYGGILVQRSLVSLAARFFETTFRGEDFRAPGRLYAPTVRYGVELSGTSGLQVGVGFDIWKSNVRSDGFFTLLLTPKGIGGYLGYQVSEGLSLGLSFKPTGTSLAAMWSVVF